MPDRAIARQRERPRSTPVFTAGLTTSTISREPRLKNAFRVSYFFTPIHIGSPALRFDLLIFLLLRFNRVKLIARTRDSLSQRRRSAAVHA